MYAQSGDTSHGGHFEFFFLFFFFSLFPGTCIIVS
jgi:hypothetical protein